MLTLDEAIIWKQIEEFPNYSVSSDGQIRNDKTGKLRVLNLDHNGYVVCGLYRSGKRKECKVHRLVACAFIANPYNKPHINHKNGIVTDNTVNNLEWCTQQENNYHAWNVLDSSERRKKMADYAHNRVWSQFSREKVSKLNKGRKHTEQSRKNMSEAHRVPRPYRRKTIICVETGIAYTGFEDATRKTGCSRTGISNVLSGRTKTCGGYHWERG